MASLNNPALQKAERKIAAAMTGQAARQEMNAARQAISNPTIGATSQRIVTTTNANLLNKGPGIATRTVNGTGGMLSKLSGYAVYGSMAAGAVGYLASKAPKFLQGPMGKLTSLVSVPSNLAYKTTPEHVVSNTIRSTGNLTRRYVNTNLGNTLRDAGTSLKGFETRQADRLFGNGQNAGWLAKNIFHPVADLFVTKDGEKAGIIAKLFSKLDARAGAKAAKAIEIKDALVQNGTIEKVGKSLEANPLLVGLGKNLNSENIAETFGKAGSILETAKNMKPLADGMSGPVVDAALGKAGQETLKAAGRDLKPIVSAIGKAEVAAQKSAGISNLPKSIRGASDHFRNMSTGQALQVGANAAMNVASSMSLAKKIMVQYRAMEDMYTGLTGKKAPLLPTTLLWGKSTPPAVKEAAGLMVKEFGLSVVLEAIGIGATIAMAAGKIGGMKVTLAQAGISMAAQSAIGVFGGQNPLLPYAALKDAMTTGTATREHYLGFITTAIADTRGVPADNPDLQAMADYYLAQKATPVDVMNDAKSGKFNEKVYLLRDKKELPDMHVTPGLHAQKELQRRGMTGLTKTALGVGAAAAAAGAIYAGSNPKLRADAVKMAGNVASKGSDLIASGKEIIGKHSGKIVAQASKATTATAGVGV